MIKVEHVSLVIKKKTILDDINAEFSKGQIHGLIGRNGSGKTVLMKCICGFMKPTGGKITVDRQIIGQTCDFPKNTGVIIETPRFINHYSAMKNLKMLASISGLIDTDKIREILNCVGLDPDSRLHVGKYSLGMRQRLGLAQAIMEDPSLLILDEPFNGLDKDGVADIRTYLLNLKSCGKTIIIASHQSEDINALCDSVHEMDKGKMKLIYRR